VTDNDLQGIISDAINNIDDVLSSLEFFKPGNYSLPTFKD
jgi:hypothetical protein